MIESEETSKTPEERASTGDTLRLKEIGEGFYVVVGAYKEKADFFSISPLFPEVTAAERGDVRRRA